MILLLTLACSTPDEAAPIMEEAAPEVTAERSRKEAEALALASDATAQVLTTFSNRLHEVSSSEGLEGAIRVCSEEAQGMTALLATETGARVGRSSLYLRNPANEGPEWVQDYLKKNEKKLAGDVDGISEVHEDTARVARPIAMRVQCLGCHGDKIDAKVKPILAERYPQDRAVGYREGELRGAVWAEVPVR